MEWPGFDNAGEGRSNTWLTANKGAVIPGKSFKKVVELKKFWSEEQEAT